MDRDLWARITDVFDAALDRPVDERWSYVEQACAGDDALRAEVAKLLRQLEKAGDFLERPAVSIAPRLSDGQIVQGRYRIETLLGRGGMGEVYRAHDDLINEKVALKTLRSDLAGDPEFLRRFRREVQIARKVTHPSVCRVFEFGVHDESGELPVHFFTMQFLDGETLAVRIRRDNGPIPRDEALSLAQQMAAALDAAHAVGVVHRDFKSANVMLCAGRAVVMDFGLARPALADARHAEATVGVTVGTQVAGTVAYMSPEQLSGGAVTTASDIYSFGIVLFEMLTGRLPFNDEHIIRSAMQRAAEGVLNVRALAPDLDAHSAAVIARCLRLDPAKRFGTAGAAAAHLWRRGWHAPTWSRRQWTKAAVGIAALGGGMSLIPAVFRFNEASIRLPEGATVLVGQIANLTDDVRLDALGEVFRNQLSQSVQVNLVDDRRLSEVLAQMGVTDEAALDPAVLREAAWRLNAMLSIHGTVARVGPDYVLNVRLETRGARPDTPRATSLSSFSASDSDALMRSVRDAAIWVRESMGESASTIASFDVLPDHATTTSWQALAHYAQGQRYFMKQDFNAAIDKFAEALAEDPKFTLAALRRADLLISQYRQTEGFEQYRTALALLDERPVTRPEELYGRGMFALDSGDLETADRFFRTWAMEYPFDWRAPFYRMVPLCMNGHAAQALELLRRLQARMPDYGDIYVQMSRVYLVLGQTDEARALLPQIRRLNRPERTDLQDGYIRFREADCVGCLEILRRVRRSQNYRRGVADSMIQEGLLLIDAGYAGVAADNIDSFLRSGSWVDAKPQQITLLMIQAWAEMLAGRSSQAIAHARQVVENETGPLIVALAGTLFARLGAADLARTMLRVCAAFEDIPLYRMSRHRIDAELSKLAGDDLRHVEQLRQAAALEPPIAHRQYLIEALPPGSPERLALSVNAVRVPWQNLRPPMMHHIGAMAIAVADVNAAGIDEPFARKFAESSKQLEAVL